MHRTKGLEFDSVVVAPSDMRLKATDIEDEKRLRYVAVTRARHRLVLCDGPRELALCDGTAWEAANALQGRRFDTIDEEGSGAFRLYDLSFKQDYLIHSIREGDALRIDRNALWHNNVRLCSLANDRQETFYGQPLEGIYVSEIVRNDNFGDNDQWKPRCAEAVQKRGWYYIMNAAGYLRPVDSKQ